MNARLKRGRMVLAAIAALLFASAIPPTVDAHIPGGTAYFRAGLQGPYYAGEAEYVANPLFRVFGAQVRLKAIGPETTPMQVYVVVQRGAYMAKLGMAHIERPGTFTLLLDTRLGQVVPELRRGDAVIFLDASNGRYLAKGVLKHPIVVPR